MTAKHFRGKRKLGPDADDSLLPARKNLKQGVSLHVKPQLQHNPLPIAEGLFVATQV
jgi:hypothetical protein